MPTRVYICLVKLPSVGHLVEQSTKTFARFPFVITSAIVGTGAWLVFIDRSESDPFGYLQRLILVGFLGISLFTAIALLCEKLKTGPRQALLANIGGLGVLAAYYLTLPEKIFDSNTAHIIRYLLFAAGFHFLVAVGPFFQRGEVNGFWQFNKSLFLRFLTAFLYSSVLYLGLAAAILAVDQLFDAHIAGKRYGELWVFIVGVFNTWFFLSGVPEDIEKLEGETDYPKGLKIFTQYILLPLVFIYLVILYSYEVKIVVEWNWPKGWVGYLVLGFSILGILSLLLVHPIKQRIENAWIGRISRYYYAALIPLVGLLLLAIWRRISEYGITERRYFVLVLGIWLVAMIAYFLFSKAKSIKIIPATLCGIAFLSSFGPWGAMGMSERNQRGRLTEVLTRTGILKEGKIHRAVEEVPFEDCRWISSIVRYLNDGHGLAGIQPWFDVALDTVATGSAYSRYTVSHERPRRIVAMMGVTYLDEWQTGATKNFSFQSSNEGVVDIRGFISLIQGVSFNQWDTTKTIFADGVQWKLAYTPATLAITLTPAGRTASALRFDLTQLVSKLEEEYGNRAYATNIPAFRMSIEQTLAATRVRLCFRTVGVQKVGSHYQGNYLQADVLMGAGGK